MLSFELKNYYKNKIFVGVTLVLVIAIALVMFYPRIADLIGTTTPQEKETMLLVSDDQSLAQTLAPSFVAAFENYEIKIAPKDEETIKKQISEGKAACAVIVNADLLSFTYLVNNLSVYDTNSALCQALLTSVYRANALMQSGLSAEDAQLIMSTEAQGATVNLGKDQMQNFFYTYVMIFALYMVILLYGQMVATGVAGEKGNRSMELLVTSVKPTPMMFGKVIAACIAGFVQLLCIFGSAVLFFNLNKAYWQSNPIICSIFDMPIDLLLYMLLFFVLGFFVYAFLYGATGSMVSKTEDVNTAVMPLTLLFVAGFMVVIFSVSGGTVDSLLMKICSYFPLTSPMAMFTRIAMSVVPPYEIIISAAVLVVSAVLIGILSAKIYRVGVLNYGNKPKLGQLIKMIFRS